MVIKYESEIDSKELGLESFSYINGCEDVTTERVSVSELLREFCKTYCEPERIKYEDYQKSAKSLETTLKNRRRIKQGNDVEDFSDVRISIASMLSASAGKLSKTRTANLRENEKVFTFLAEALLGGENINDNWFYDTKLKIITYIKDDDKIYKLFTLGVVYLLNDNGKTIDIIK